MNGIHSGGIGKRGFSQQTNTDIKVKTVVDDTTTDFLDNKVIVGGTLVKLVVDVGGGNKKLKIYNEETPQSKQVFFWDFAQYNNIAIGSLCPAANNGQLWVGNTMGFFSHKDFKVIGFIAETPKYLTNAVNQHLRFQIKRTTMNTLRTADITMATGDNIINLDLIPPQSNPNYGYYFGNYWDAAALAANNVDGVIGLQFGGIIPKNSMCFIAHCNISAGAAFYGSKCRVLVEEV